MNKDDLQARKKELDQEFSEKETQRQAHLKAVNEIAEEQLQIRGRYQEVEDLLSKQAGQSKVSPSADVIDVEAAVKEKK